MWLLHARAQRLGPPPVVKREGAETAGAWEARQLALVPNAVRRPLPLACLQSTVFDVLLARVASLLASLPVLPEWRKGAEGSAHPAAPLPSFNTYPLPYVTAIGDHLMAMPQQLEVGANTPRGGESQGSHSSVMRADWVHSHLLFRPRHHEQQYAVVPYSAALPQPAHRFSWATQATTRRRRLRRAAQTPAAAARPSGRSWRRSGWTRRSAARRPCTQTPYSRSAIWGNRCACAGRVGELVEIRGCLVGA